MSSHFDSIAFVKWLNSNHEESFVTGTAPFPETHRQYPWLWMATSGTTAGSEAPPRWIAHTRQSLLNSARSVCTFLQVTPQDRWARILPAHHMGGLSLYIRAEVSGCKVLDDAPEWDPFRTAEWLRAEKATLVSLVPAQVYDWVKNKIRAPSSLRLAIVGADHLDPQLAIEAKSLGWPLLASYGLTETASMIACEKTESVSNGDWLQLLPHAEVRLSTAGQFSISCTSLFSAELIWLQDEKKYDLKKNRDFRGIRSWECSDFGEVKNREIKILGRTGDLVKILGSMVNLAELDQKMLLLLKQNQLHHSVVFIASKDTRKGHQLIMVGEGLYDLDLEKKILTLWNQNRSGLHRAEKFAWVNTLPRTELAKIKRNELMRSLGWR